MLDLTCLIVVNFMNLKEEINYFIKSKIFVIPLIIFSILGYGFAITNSSIHIDTLAFDIYYRGGEFIAQGRFGAALFENIFHVMNYNPFFNDFLSVILLMAVAVLFCVLLKKIVKDKISITSYSIFASTFVTYSLIHEIFVYNTGITIAFSFFNIWLCMYFLSNYFQKPQQKYLAYITAILTFTIAIYESFASVYLCTIFALFILEIIFNKKKYSFQEFIIKVLQSLLPLIGAIVIGKIITIILMRFFHIESSMLAAKNIYYFTNGIIPTIKQLIRTCIENFILKGLFYYPIFLFAVFTLISLIFGLKQAYRKKDIVLFLSFLCFFIAAISLSIVQGIAAQYRTCQSFMFYVAFLFFIFSALIEKKKMKKWLKNCFICFLFLLIFYQAKDLHHWFYLNNLRYQNEEKVLLNIAYDLEKEYDISKPIIFVGNFEVSPYVEKEIYADKNNISYKIIKNMASILGEDLTQIKINQTNVQSYLNWGMKAFGPSTQIVKWYDRLGYTFQTGTDEMYDQALKICEEMPNYPKKGYIFETNDFIVINLNREGEYK